MTDKVLCRYYLHGACRNGQDCHFSHDWSTPASQVCKFYLQGRCAFGDSCRYDHVRPSWRHDQRRSDPHPGYVPPQIHRPPVDDDWDDGAAGGAGSGGDDRSAAISQDLAGLALGSGGQQGGRGDEGGDEEAAWNLPDSLLDEHAEPEEYADNTDLFYDDDEVDEDDDESYYGGCMSGQGAWQGQRILSSLASGGSGRAGWAQCRGLCGQYLMTGTCTSGTSCKLLHGNYCEVCSKWALHPSDCEAVAAHVQECRQRHQRLAARLASAEVECGVCLEKVLSKQPPSQRKFGLMACAHAFCLSCIRSWRSKQDGEVDVDSAVRTCPICRTTTHFVTPSTTWPSSEDAKERIVSGYKAHLAAIDCRHYALGEGRCPFGGSCFYRHVDRDGNPEAPVQLRRAANADEEVRVLQPVRLSHFLDIAAACRSTRRGRR